ncbi:MAG: O-antigen ligase family protein [Candidatus Pacebacteria bacterium]|nr:O-antigen ligase family protein [Candidatus Paceibacterota bacterium]
MQKLIGESLIDSNISGVANFVFEGQKIVRSYGTFPHPNILGGFLIFTIFITIFLYLESKSGYLSSRILSFRLNRQDNNTNRHKSQGVFYVYFWVVLIFVQISALFLTFSRVSWIGAILAVILLCFFCLFNKIVSRETILLRQVNFFRKILNISYNYKELLIAVILFLLVIISNFFLIQARFNGDMFSNSNLPNNSAISDRLFYNNVSRETISNNFLFGSGIGTSIFQINNYLKNNDIEQEIEPWQYQPAHNIYFLIASEVGIIGLLFFLLLFIVYVISNSIKIVSRETISNNKLSPYLLVILMTFLFIGVFDHYFWTLQQGQLIFWLVLALIMVISKNTRK